MSDEPGSDSGNPITIIKEAAEAIKEIAGIMYAMYGAGAKYISPQYKLCAENFLKITADLRGYAGNVLEFLAPFYFFSFFKADNELQTEFTRLSINFRSKQLGDWISRLRFRCSEINTYYDQYCKTWVKNTYGEYVVKQKQKQADELLEQLTRMDAHLIDVLSKDVVKPLSDFVDDAFEALVVRNDVGAAKTVHDTFRQKMKPIFNSVEETLQQLEEAAQNFYKLAQMKTSENGSEETSQNV